MPTDVTQARRAQEQEAAQEKRIGRKLTKQERGVFTFAEGTHARCDGTPGYAIASNVVPR